MVNNFQAVNEPSAEIVERIAAAAPENPFATNEYMAVRRRLGSQPCAFWIDDAGEVASGCLAFLTRGRLNARVEITSLPVLEDKEMFWRGAFDFCRKHDVSLLSVYTFASLEPLIGRESKRIEHKRRSEYRLDLKEPDIWAVMNRRHHRLIKRARSAQVAIRRNSDTDARNRHIELANMSLDRRRGRGDEIGYRIELDDVNAFIECGAGEIFQAVRDGEVFSSLLVARSRTGGYAQSSGTSEEGRSLGSSHFIFYETACILKTEGCEVFNLGGADEQSTGLQEFKLGLGSKRIELESADFYTGSTLKKFATRAAALLKSFPGLPIGT